MLNMLVSVLCVPLNAFLTYFGIKKCYETNEALDRTAFFERFFLLSVPVLMKLATVLLPTSLVALLWMHYVKDAHPLLHKRFPMLLSIAGPITTWLNYTLIDRSLKRLGGLLREPLTATDR